MYIYRHEDRFGEWCRPLPGRARPLAPEVVAPEHSGFRVQGVGFRGWDAEFGVQCFSFEVFGLGFEFQGGNDGLAPEVFAPEKARFRVQGRRT